MKMYTGTIIKHRYLVSKQGNVFIWDVVRRCWVSLPFADPSSVRVNLTLVGTNVRLRKKA